MSTQKAKNMATSAGIGACGTTTATKNAMMQQEPRKKHSIGTRHVMQKMYEPYMSSVRRW